jgi:hypothetical protein
MVVEEPEILNETLVVRSTRVLAHNIAAQIRRANPRR